ncbi:MAG: polysaccharide biosynthesis protein [Prevotella sp.]|nr:polysaccharide biosynthesis protein [Prevotella sp.]
MASLKSLAKDTAIYGLSSIVGRFLNYLLVPLYTAKLSAESGGYGVITNVYAYTALILVILTYGMETTLFRYSNKDGENADTVFSTALKSVSFTSLTFIALVLVFISPLSAIMGYAEHPAYIWTMAVTVAVDAVHCILFARLRYEKRPVKFAALKLFFIILNISLNIFFFVVVPEFTDRSTDVGYAFYINLACSMIVTFCFAKEIKTALGVKFDGALLRRMLSYGWPILVLGIAGILNQTADKILFPYIYDAGNANEQLGIYGAASKIAMIMAMITQAFRYAYEPFVFGKAKDKDGDSREVYAKAMKYFIIFTLMAFLLVSGYMGILRHIIGRDYWSGLRVVPVVMVAEIMMGIYFNLSFWYKLIDKTIWGAWFSGIGCAVLVATNIIFVPVYGYMACAWAGVAGYGVAMTLSYLVGQRHYPIRYPLGEIAFYVLLAAALFAGITVSNDKLPLAAAIGTNTLLVALFAFVVVKRDFPLSSLPVVGKYFRDKK